MFNIPGAAGRPEPTRKESAEPIPEEAANCAVLESEPQGEDAAETESEGAEAKPAPQKKPEEGIESDPYEWGRCAITAQIVWLPGGQVMAGVRNHFDAPIVALLAAGNLTTLPGHAAELPLPTPEALGDLLARLREDLPNRARAKAEREAAESKKAEEAKARRETAKSKVQPKEKPARAKEKPASPAKPAVGKSPGPAQVNMFELLTGGK